MKKFTLSLIALTGCIILNAQITMTYESHGLMVGDAHNFTMANAAEPGSAGANQIWDFSNLVNNNKLLTSFMLDPMETEHGAAIDASANTVIQENGNQFYFNVNKNSIEQMGTVACGNVLTYDKPFVKMQYPFTYQSSFAGTFSGAQQLSNGTSIAINGVYDVEADGYGTLLLPGGAQIENVLRVKTIRTRISDNYRSSVITYRWYCANVRYPILVIIQHESPTKISTSTVAYYKDANKLKSAPLETPELVSNKEIKVYPNPYHDVVNLDYTLNEACNVSIEIFDGMGRRLTSLLEKQYQEEGAHTYSFSTKSNNFSSGLYYIKINMGNNSTIKKIVEFD